MSAVGHSLHAKKKKLRRGIYAIVEGLETHCYIHEFSSFMYEAICNTISAVL